ncbi:MAG: hypothetical protein H7175_05010 [Burkholderiales bacterium]|nr:hypothetical protein [Anaerolineae bacterium]
MAVTETQHTLHPLKRRRWLRCALIALIALMVLAIGALYVLYRAIEGLGHMVDFMVPVVANHEVDDLDNMLGFSLPENVSDFHSTSYSFMQERVIGMRFSFPANDLDEFTMLLGFTEPLEAGVNPTENHNDLFANEDWWQTEDTNVSVGGTFSEWSAAQTYYDLFVDQTDPAQYIVYLVVVQG